MMASPPQQSYAQAAGRSPQGDENSPRVFGYSVNRLNSGDSNFAASRIGPNVQIAELVEESSGQQRSRHGSLATSSSQGPSRRPSIAQVLSRFSSSYISDPRSSASVDQHPISQYDGTIPAKTTKSQKKKKKSRHRRRKSSQTPGYGDFLASQTLSEEPPPQKTAEDTPLLAAIIEGDLDRVRKIVEEESSLAERDYPSNEVLQTAALAGRETVFSYLLDSGRFDIDGRDARERTALYAATSRGHDSIRKLLISRNAKPLTSEELEIAKIELRTWQDFEAQVDLQDKVDLQDNIPLQREQTIGDAEMTLEPDQELPSHPEPDEVDHIYKLAVGSCENIKEMEQKTNKKRESAQRRGEWVKGPMKPAQLVAPQQEIFTQHQQVRYPGFGFEIPVVEFDFRDTGGHRIVSPTPTVDDLLYGTRGDEVIGKAGSSEVEAICQWYHIPSNHLGWAEDLIRKIYEKRDTREQAKRDIILAREPFYNNGSDHDHLDPTLLDPRPQARALRPQCRYMTLERDKAQRLSTALFLDIPFVHWETEENRAEMHHVMEQVRQACKDDLENQNTQRKLPKVKPDIKAIQERRFWSKNEKLLCAYLYNSPPVHPRRTLDQFYYHMLEDTKDRDQDQVITRYYANQWKRNHNLPEDDEELKFAFPDPVEPKFSFSLKPPSDETVKLERKLGTSQPLSSISQTSLRNQGTPRSGGINLVSTNTENNDNAKEERHVLMVDQLWIWILDENTIITSFPQNWAHDDDEDHTNNKDPMDVLKSIHRYLTLVNRRPLESVHDLAQLIVYKCLATFCQKSTPYGPMRILDVYESAIASVTDEETKIFDEFAARSKTKRSNEQITADSRNTPEEMYSIHAEIQQLKEIKDIQDELHILSVLLENQTSVLQQAMDAFKSPNEVQETAHVSISTSNLGKANQNQMGQATPYNSQNHFTKLYNMIVEQEKRRKGLQIQAEQANKALNHLLDLKQKQANVSEARSARWTAESTKQQGNIMVLFTLVTIIFAPLSLMGTMFTLQVVEYPPRLHLGYVLKWMFVVSIAVIVPLIGLVVYTTRRAIAKVIRRLDQSLINHRWLGRQRWERKKKNLRKKVDEWEGEGFSSVADMDEKGSEKRKLGFWRKKNVAATVDVEKGVTVNGVEEVEQVR